MSELRRRQALYARLEAVLVAWVFGHPEWEFTNGDGYRPDRKGHMPGSLHYERLAGDKNLFVAGVFIRSGEHEVWVKIGEFWERLDPLCAWGGRFEDANHFSIRWGGRKLKRGETPREYRCMTTRQRAAMLRKAVAR